MSPSKAGGRRWKRVLFFVVLQLLLVLVLAEVSLRLLAPRHDGLRMLLHDSADATAYAYADTLEELMRRTMLGFVPGSVQFGFVLNSRSFRTREYEVGPAPDRYRVVALGDSFTFASGGLPHEDHWTTRLEAELGRRLPRPVEVLRLGVPGTGPAFQLRLWQLEASRLEPDAVVLAFFVGNDFVDHQGDCGPFGGGDRGLPGRLASVSYLFRAARNLTRVLMAAGIGRGDTTGGGEAPGGEPIPGFRETFNWDRPSFSEEAFLAIEAERMALCLRSERAAFERLAERVVGVVVELVREVEASGASCVVMLVPDQYQVDRDLVDAVLRTTGGSLGDLDLERPQRFMKRALEAAGVEVLDLLPVLRDAAAGGPVYRPRDTHWNRRGNDLAAAALVGHLVRRGHTASAEVFADGLEDGAGELWSWVEVGGNVRPITCRP